MSGKPYEEMARERKRARALYLELRSLGVKLWVEEEDEDSTGYTIGARHPASGVPESMAKHIRANKPGLLKVLLSRWDPDLQAIRQEGG